MKTILALALALAAGTAHAAEFGPLEGRTDTLTMQGDIGKGDATKLMAEINTRNAIGLTTQYLMLDSEGGLTLPAFEIAEVVTKNHLIPVVDANARCISSCVTIFAAGEGRAFWQGAQIGVHSAYTLDANGAPVEAPDGSIYIARHYKDMGVPAVVIGKLVSTLPADMTYLTADDLLANGWAYNADTETTASTEAP